MSAAPTLYDDHGIVVVDKPSGVGVVPGRHDDASLAAELGLLVCHRLDVGTSGALVLARTADAQRRMSEAFAAAAVHKTYLAVCVGALPDDGAVDLPLGEWKRGRVQIGRGRPARTRYRVDARVGARLRVLAYPETGRTHQIRAHLSAAGAPIVGDEDYGGPPAPRILLHAAEVVLPWPTARDRLTVRAPEPAEFVL